MSNTTNISINVDSIQVEATIDSLDRLRVAAERAAAAIAKLGSTSVTVDRIGGIEHMEIRPT